MSMAIIAASQGARLDGVSRGLPKPADGLGGEGGGPPDRGDVDAFRQAMREVLPGPVLQAGAGAAPLQQLSDYLRGQVEARARQMKRVQLTRDPGEMMKVMAGLVDQGVESELLSKVIGKTVSTVDQLTKLS